MTDDTSRTDGRCLQLAHRYDLTRLDSRPPARTARHLTGSAPEQARHWTVQPERRAVQHEPPTEPRRFWHHVFVLLGVK